MVVVEDDANVVDEEAVSGVVDELGCATPGASVVVCDVVGSGALELDVTVPTVVGARVDVDETGVTRTAMVIADVEVDAAVESDGATVVDSGAQSTAVSDVSVETKSRAVSSCDRTADVM